MDLIREAHLAFERRFFPTNLQNDHKAKAMLMGWYKLSLMYLRYFLCGGDKNLREEEIKKEDMDGRSPRMTVTHYRSHAEFAAAAHASNWILIRGKHYPADPEPWQPLEDWQERLSATEPQLE